MHVADVQSETDEYPESSAIARRSKCGPRDLIRSLREPWGADEAASVQATPRTPTAYLSSHTLARSWLR